jgi:hypothetical protein
VPPPPPAISVASGAVPDDPHSGKDPTHAFIISDSSWTSSIKLVLYGRPDYGVETGRGTTHDPIFKIGFKEILSHSLPDYVSLSGGALVGGQIVMDRNFNFYLGAGITNPGVSLVAGKAISAETPRTGMKQEELSNFLTGWGDSFGYGITPAYLGFSTATTSALTGSIEIGVGTPGPSYSMYYTWPWRTAAAIYIEADGLARVMMVGVAKESTETTASSESDIGAKDYAKRVPF